jgi:hypothetical protein
LSLNVKRDELAHTSLPPTNKVRAEMRLTSRPRYVIYFVLLHIIY